MDIFLTDQFRGNVLDMTDVSIEAIHVVGEDGQKFSVFQSGNPMGAKAAILTMSAEEWALVTRNPTWRRDHGVRPVTAPATLTQGRGSE